MYDEPDSTLVESRGRPAPWSSRTEMTTWDEPVSSMVSLGEDRPVTPISSLYDEDDDGFTDGRKQGVYSGSRGSESATPPMSVIDGSDEEEVIEELPESETDPESHVEEEEEIDNTVRVRVPTQRPPLDLSTIEEEAETKRDTTTDTERMHFDSAEFMPGSDANFMLEEAEKSCRKRNVFIEEDPRFDESYHAKEHSWEPSPHNSPPKRTNRKPKAGETSPILGRERQIAGSETTEKREGKAKEAKRVSFREESIDQGADRSPNTNTATSSTGSSGSTMSTITRTPTGPPPTAARVANLRQMESSPVLDCSVASSHYQSTPTEGRSSRQMRRSLREAFHDVSELKEEKIYPPTVAPATSSTFVKGRGQNVPPVKGDEPSLSTSSLIRLVKSVDTQQSDLASALVEARQKRRERQTVDFRKGLLESSSSSSSRSTTDPSSRAAPAAADRVLQPRQMNGEGSRSMMHIQPQPPSIHPLSNHTLPPRPPQTRSVGIGRCGTDENDRRYEKERSIADTKRDASTTTTTSMGRPDSRASLAESERSSKGVGNGDMSGRSSSTSDDPNRVLSSNQRLLDFSFVPINDQAVMTFKARNLLSTAIRCTFKLRDRKTSKGPRAFEILDCNEFIVQAREHVEIRVRFRPTELNRYIDKLTIGVMGNGSEQSFTIPVYGSGGEANVLVCQRSGLYAHKKGDFALRAHSSSQCALSVENTGERTAFVRVVVVDKAGARVEGVKITPSDAFIVATRNIQAIKLDLSACLDQLKNADPALVRSSSSTGLGSRSTSSSSLNSIGSSASSTYADQATLLRNGLTYTVQLYWGEETLRQRMRTASQQFNMTMTAVTGRDDFSARFHEELPYKPPADKPITKADVDIFQCRVRCINVNVMRPGSSFIHSSSMSADDDDGDKTLVPDDTFRGANDTVISTVADLTRVNIRR